MKRIYFVTIMVGLALAATFRLGQYWEARHAQPAQPLLLPFVALCPKSKPVMMRPRSGPDGSQSVVLWCSDRADWPIYLYGGDDPKSPFTFADEMPTDQPTIYMRENK